MSVAGVNNRPFNLLGWFSVLSFVSIVLIGSIAATVLARFLSDHLLQRDAILTMELVNSIVQVANARHASEPGHNPRPDPDLLHKNPMTALEHYLRGDRGKLEGHRYAADAGLQDFFQALEQMPDVLRLNIYTENGTIAWSNIDELIGKQFGINDELEAAFAGESITKERAAGEGHKAEHHKFREPASRYVEHYFPIWDEARMGVAAVVEVYRASLTLFEAVDRARWMVWLSSGLAWLFIFLILFWIVYRANRTIQQQQRQLVESETFTAIGEMASAVAHGFRNPLASVRSSAELGLEEVSPNMIQQVLDDIITEVDRLEIWIRELLVYASPEGGEPECVQLNHVIARCLNDFTERMKRQAVKLVLQTRDDLPLVGANDVALGQVFSSLIANALEAMPDGGQLTATSQLTPDGRRAEVVIVDTGYGIPQMQLSKIFEPLFTTKRGGLGVGLALTRRTLHRFGGMLDISSTEGQGTTVTLRVPVRR